MFKHSHCLSPEAEQKRREEKIVRIRGHTARPLLRKSGGRRISEGYVFGVSTKSHMPRPWVAARSVRVARCSLTSTIVKRGSPFPIVLHLFAPSWVTNTPTSVAA